MADLYRVTFAFSGARQGWTESFVVPRDGTTPGNLASVLLTLYGKRVELLGREYQGDGFRVAKIRTAAGAPVKRQVFLHRQTLKPGDQTIANAGSPYDDCILVRGTDAAGERKRNVFFGGPPDSIVDDAGDLKLAKVNWGAKFASWNGEAIAQQLGWLADIPVGEQQIISYVTNAQLITTFTLGGNLFVGANATAQQTVRVRQLNGKSVFNGQLVVIPLTATTCQTVRAIATQAFSSVGFMQAYTIPKPFVPAAGWGAAQYAFHDRGHPLFSSRGRAPARARK